MEHLSKSEISEREDQLALIRQLSDFLGPIKKEFLGGDTYDAALGFANQQTERWTSFLKFLDGIPLELKEHYQPIRALLVGQSQASVLREMNFVFVFSQIPLLACDPPEQLISAAQRWPIIAMTFIARRNEMLLLSAPSSRKVTLSISEAIASAIIASALSNPNGTHSSKNQKIDAELERSRNSFDELKKLLEQQLDTIRVKATDLLSGAEQNFISLQAQVSADLEDWERLRALALDGMRAEVREFAKIESSISLWRTKANWHTATYIIIGIIFSGSLLGVALLFVLGFASDFVERVAKIPSDHQFLGIAVLATPTLAIAWLLRFLARLAIQNLSLAHDARQRHAQVNTYLRLLGDPKKPITENERILALAALFRPLPGMGPDDVHPPTVADLLKDAHQRMGHPSP